MRVWAPEVSLSMADWASRVSVVMASDSEGSRLDTQIVEFLRVAPTLDGLQVQM